MCNVVVVVMVVVVMVMVDTCRVSWEYQIPRKSHIVTHR